MSGTWPALGARLSATLSRQSFFGSKKEDSWAAFEDAAGPLVDGQRRVRLGPDAGNGSFPGNSVRTSKYNVLTFLPIFLFTMFSRVAYLYFAAQASLAWWAVVSPFAPYGPTLSLLFVLAVAAIKAIVEDRKRHQEDRRTNNSTAHVLHANGIVTDVRWHNVAVGMVLEVRDGEDFPADLLCLHCASEHNVCYVKTTNLDGESNLKIRRPVDMKGAMPRSQAEAAELLGLLQCEPPNARLHTFEGRLSFHSLDGSLTAVPVTIDEVLLRGCTLKNSGRIAGLVVYTGAESRIQMNAAAPPRKRGAFDTFLNVQITLVLVLQMALCLACSLVSLWWRNSAGYARYYLALNIYNEGNYMNGAQYVGILFLTFWILLSYLVPLSLFVTMEIVKFVLCGVYIARDPAIREGKGGEPAIARNSDIVEDLGLVRYVFSDKTGTLTANEMQLRAVAMRGATFGGRDVRLEQLPPEQPEANLRAFDPRLAAAAKALRADSRWRKTLHSGGSDAAALGAPLPAIDPEGGEGLALGLAALDFWTSVCVCHTLIVEHDAAQDGAAAGTPAFQGPSPDEVALVGAARRLGFEFVARSRTHVTLKLHGEEVRHELLNLMDFTSERARMSVITRAPDGTIRLFSKGADTKILPRLRAGTAAELVTTTQRHLHDFSVQGLRTLMLATRVLDAQQWAAWDKRYQAAASSLDAREERIAQAAEEIEKDLELVGLTAIEDKLQEGVPRAIGTLIAAGMKVWMITGDKQETAINIAVACRLVHRPAALLRCNAGGSAEAAAARLAELLAEANKGAANGAKAGGGGGVEMVIDGPTLSRVLGTPAEGRLAALAARCSGVVVCRASPAQKAAIVRLMARNELFGEQVDGPAASAPARQQRCDALDWARGVLGLARREMARTRARSLAIGDGANDVAMIQAADIGVGVMGKEGRQAVNNSDFAIGQFRFLTRLLLVHGALSDYRLARLIRYSFYKNIAFSFSFFFYQIFNGWSGQATLDGITAAFYNAFFTSLPIGAFALFDRPLRRLSTLEAHPEAYNRKPPLTAAAFWKSGVALAVVHALIVFFVPYLSLASDGARLTDDLFSYGKTIFLGIIGAVSLEVALVSRFWTAPFTLAWALSFGFCFPWLPILGLILEGLGTASSSQIGVGQKLMATPRFWLQILLVYVIAFSVRVVERAARWLFFPNDNMILAELEPGGPGGLRRKLPARFHWGPIQLDALLGPSSDAAASQAVAPKSIALGGSDLRVSPLGLGTLQWGDPGCGFGKQYDEAQLREVFDAAVAGGITFFDTAEVYGYQGIKEGQSSEHLVGRFASQADASAPLVLGTKFFTVPWTNVLVGGGFRLGRQAMIDALRASMGRLGVSQVELYQVHFPFPAYGNKLLAEALAQAVGEGLCRAVGVCNYSSEQLQELHGLLAQRGVPLASNQVKYNLLERAPEKSGLLQRCADLNVTVVAHSPLSQGLLTGKYVQEGGGSKADSIRPVLKLMQLIGALSGNKSVPQVALGYLMAKGAVPIPGAKTVEQVSEHLGVLQWVLDDNEVAMLDERLNAL
ncbi:hypothetical protein WJX81_002623 [Elliptochloris bilobata]|uniref:Phospholipid-transporting ATPase n=1 Tax=Elliptochloris bilobata TaxID=381761 RepID=A0AAW1RR97_9CHLO